jgi:hypothetical protein
MIRLRLYSGSSKQFIEDAYQNRIAEKLRLSFIEQVGHNPTQQEVNSWKNSLRATSMVFEHAHLTDNGVILEYQLPQSSYRLDCMICGKDNAGKDKAVIMELKQWDRCKKSDGENEVLTWVGGSERETLHPSVRVGQYRVYLEDAHTAFHEGPDPIQLNACAYLHNYPYDPQDVLFDGKFREVVLRNPVFTMDDVPRLETFLVDWVGAGQGLEILQRVEESKCRPSKKLMDHVGNVIKGKPEYVLLDEQLIVYDKVFAIAKEGFHEKKKTVLIVKGGPGTGKSVIAINLMADLSGGFVPEVTVVLSETKTAKDLLKDFYCQKCGKRKSECQCQRVCEKCGRSIESCTCPKPEKCPVCGRLKEECTCLEVGGTLQVAENQVGASCRRPSNHARGQACGED